MNTKLIDLRKRNSLKQSEMADIIGVTQGMYSRIEKGLHNLSQIHIEALSKQFNLPDEYFPI